MPDKKIPILRPPGLSQRTVAILLALLSSGLWAAWNTGLQYFNEYGAVEMITGISVWSTLITLGYSVVKKQTRLLLPHNLKMILFRGLLVTTSWWLAVYALHHIPVVNYILILFLSPFLVAAGAHFFLRETLPWHNIFYIALGLFGIIVAIGPELRSEGADQMGYSAVGIILMIGVVSQILLKKLMEDNETTESALISTRVVAGLVGMAYLLSPFSEVSASVCLEPHFILVTGALGSLGLIAGTLGIYAVRRLPAAISSSLDYWRIIPTALMAYLLFGTIPTSAFFAGSCVIIGAGILLYWNPSITLPLPKKVRANSRTA